MTYMAQHFNDLVQQYCATGVVFNNDIANLAQYPERMYYGQHDPSAPLLSFVQTSMTGTLSPVYTVKVDLSPDSDVTDGASWPVTIGGVNPYEAVVGLIEYPTPQTTCLRAIGTSGTLNFTNVSNPTAIEGGTFTMNGAAAMVSPWTITNFCNDTPPTLPCCP